MRLKGEIWRYGDLKMWRCAFLEGDLEKVEIGFGEGKVFWKGIWRCEM